MPGPWSPLVPGKWQMTESENFDAFMAKLGVGYLVRKLGNASKPLVTITEKDGGLEMTQESLVKSSSLAFKIDTPFDETTADGRKVKSLMTLEKPTVMVHRMDGTEGGMDSICWREFAEKQMICTCKAGDITTVRKYERVQEKK